MKKAPNKATWVMRFTIPRLGGAGRMVFDGSRDRYNAMCQGKEVLKAAMALHQLNGLYNLDIFEVRINSLRRKRWFQFWR